MSINCPCEWRDFVGWIIPFVSSPKDEFHKPPSAVIESFVRRVAHDFAVKSGALRKKVYVDLACGVCDYPIPCLEQEDIISYKEVRLNGEVLDGDFYDIQDDVLYLENKPVDDIIEGLCIEYSYAPCLHEVCVVPPELCTRYREAITYGVLMHLFSMPHMDWSSAESAKTYTSLYDSAISSAKVDIRKRKSSKRKTIYDIRTRYLQ